MKKILLLVLLVSALSGCTKTEVPPTGAGSSSLQAFLPQWEKAQSRFINGDPTLWKQNASHRGNQRGQAIQIALDAGGADDWVHAWPANSDWNFPGRATM